MSEAGGQLRPTRLWVLAVLFVVVAVLAWLILLGRDAVLTVSPLASISLLLVAAGEVVTAGNVRARVERRAGVPALRPLAVARAVALAKASSVVGAAVAGAWLGVGLHALPRVGSIDAARQQLVSAVVGLVCGLALVAAALYLERSCRVPDAHRASRSGLPRQRER